MIAFSGEYAGNFDVYIVSSDGGEPKRITWHSGADIVEGWTPDGKERPVQRMPKEPAPPTWGKRP